MPEEEDELTETGEKAIKSVAKGAGIVLVGLLFSKFGGYLYNVAVARYLDAAAYGTISLGIAILGLLAPFCVLGLRHGINRYAAYYKGKGNTNKTKGTIFTGLKVITVTTLAVSFLLFVFSEYLAINIFNEPNATIVFRIFAIALPFKIYTMTLVSISDAFQKMKYRVVPRYFFRKGSRVFLVLLFFVLGYELLGAAYAYLFSHVLAFAAGFYLFWKKILPRLKDAVPETNYKELLTYSWPLLFVALMSTILGKIDKMMLGFFETSSSVGIYNTALLTAAFLGVVATSIKKITMPVFSDLLGKDKKEELRETFKTATKWTITASLPLFFVLLIFARQTLNLVFGSEYVAGSVALSILAVAYFFKVSLGLSSPLLKSIGKTRKILYATVISAVINIVLNLLLIPVYGMNGAAIAYLVSMFVLYSLYMYFCYKHLETNPFKHTVSRAIISAVLSVIPTYFVFRHLIDTVRTWMLPLGFLFYVTLYGFLFLILGGTDREDIKILKAIEKKSGIRIEWLREFVKKFV